MTVRKTYKYRLYDSRKRNQQLHGAINLAGLIWNHALALQKRYYRLTGRYITSGQMKSHIKHLRMRTQRFGRWKALGSQSVQEVIERLDNAYLQFFAKKRKRPPKFKKVRNYKSFVLKQSAWKLLPDKKPVLPKGKGFIRGIGQIKIHNKTYKFIKHRPLNGTIKTITIKRDSLSHLWICFSVVEEMELPKRTMTGQAAGVDFGLKTFLTDSDGIEWMHPQFFKSELTRIRSLNRSLSRKQAGSCRRKRAKYLLARAHHRIDDKRRDFHFKLAHALCDQYDFIFLEDLNLEGMKRLWGRKVSDLAFAKFVELLEWVALKRRAWVARIGRFDRTTGQCSNPHCNHQQNMTLRQRVFACEHCGLTLNRDYNAALNILRIGASMHGLDVVRPD